MATTRTEIQGRAGVVITRDSNGVPKVTAHNERDLYLGMGYCHATDRGAQMLLMRILGRGTASEHLDSSDAMLETDRFFRRMNWGGNVDSEIDKLSPAERDHIQAYCDGVNLAFSRRTPWELRLLLKYRPPPWEIGDVFLLCRMGGFLTLAQSQGEIERLFVEMVQNGVPKELLDELFPDILGDYDEDLIRMVQLGDRIVPASVKWNPAINPMIASNNWVASGARSRSGAPILSNDPHLEINRLPAVWYEIRLEHSGRFVYGATMPGICFPLIGRTNNLAWGVTYTFMDALDSWIEKCEDGKYLKDGEWREFDRREETIKRKKKPAVNLTFYENEHGVLDGDPDDGYRLATLWSGSLAGATTVRNGMRLWNAVGVEEAMGLLGEVEVSLNWALADAEGAIGYQMSGLLPIRAVGASGFTPLAGWEPENDWRGFYRHQDLPRSYNPEDGFLVTANENLSRHGSVNPHTIAMGSYRADRIRSLLADRDDLTVEDMKVMQHDLYSIQAERFMEHMRDLLPDTENGRTLREWDYCYDTDSKGACLFERVYSALFADVFGAALGKEVSTFLEEESGTLVDFYENFDTILLSERSAWFGDRTRSDVYRSAIDRALAEPANAWGEVNRLDLSHLLLGGRLPKMLGFDRGPFPMPGGRATIHQGQIYRSGGRQTSFAPSYRMIADLAEDAVHTNLAGGVSDRRFSKRYFDDFKTHWLPREYKRVGL